MALMIFGLALWWASHLFPIYLPGARTTAIARLGEGPYKRIFALVRSVGAGTSNTIRTKSVSSSFFLGPGPPVIENPSP